MGDARRESQKRASNGAARRSTVRDRPGRERAIIEAARTLFGQLGYERTTMRAIGRAAGVDPALIASYFGNKEGLFAATVAEPESFEDVLAGPRETLGRRLVERFITKNDRQAADTPFIALVRSAMTNEAAAEQLRQMIPTVFVEPLAEELGGQGAVERASLVNSILFGLAVSRYLIRIEPMASMPRDILINTLAPMVQAALDGQTTSASFTPL